MRLIKHLLGTACLLIAMQANVWAAAATYSMKVTVSMPKGSAGATLATTQPTNTKFTPCNNVGLIDAVTFALSYNAGTIPADMKDVYIILYTPNGTNSTLPTFQVGTRYSSTSAGVVFVTRWDLSEIVPATDIYLPKEKNLGGAITENLVASSLALDGVPVGTWQVVGIIADRATVNFDDPSTWAAWDAGTVILRKPWVGNANTTCD